MDGHIHQKLVRDTQSQMHVMVDCELCAERGEKLAELEREVERLRAQLAEQDAGGLTLVAAHLVRALGSVDYKRRQLKSQALSRAALTHEERAERAEAEIERLESEAKFWCSETVRLRAALEEIESLGPVSLEMDAQDIASHALSQKETEG